MSGDVHVRFRERVGVRFPCPTRLLILAKSPRAGERVEPMLLQVTGEPIGRIDAQIPSPPTMWYADTSDAPKLLVNDARRSSEKRSIALVIVSLFRLMVMARPLLLSLITRCA